MPWRAHGTHSSGDLVVARLETPRIFAEEFFWKYAAVEAGGEGIELRMMDMHVATRNIAQAAGMIEVQVPEEYHVDIFCSESQVFQVPGNSLLFGHVWRIEQRAHRIEVMCAKLGRCDFPVVAADVVENATVRGLDQVGKDWSLDVLAMSSIAC